MNTNSEEKKTHRVLWTGGWDSTYRMVELAREGATIEPVYVVNRGRRSYEIELGRVREILATLQDSRRFACTILPLRVVNKEEIPDNEEITLAFNQLNEEAREPLNQDLGPQYEWLARLSTVIPELELCIEAAEPGRLVSRDMIMRGSKTAETLFGNFQLPLFTISEKEMLTNIKKWHCEDIMHRIWFCNHPLINGVPCGLCHPCCIKIESGLEFLLPQAAIDRNLKMRYMNDDEARQYRYDVWCRLGIVNA